MLCLRRTASAFTWRDRLDDILMARAISEATDSAPSSRITWYSNLLRNFGVVGATPRKPVYDRDFLME